MGAVKGDYEHYMYQRPSYIVNASHFNVTNVSDVRNSSLLKDLWEAA